MFIGCPVLGGCALFEGCSDLEISHGWSVSQGFGGCLKDLNVKKIFLFWK